MFIKARLGGAQMSPIKVENVLKEFQIQNGTLCIEVQSKVIKPMKAMIEVT